MHFHLSLENTGTFLGYMFHIDQIRICNEKNTQFYFLFLTDGLVWYKKDIVLCCKNN